MSDDNKNYNRKINEGFAEFLGFSDGSGPSNFLGECSGLPSSLPESRLDVGNNMASKTAHEEYQELEQKRQTVETEMQQLQSEIHQLATNFQNIVERIRAAKEKLNQRQEYEKKIRLKQKELTDELNQLKANPSKKTSDTEFVFSTHQANTAQPLPENFMPAPQTLERLQMMHGVPPEFSQKQYAEFATYYLDTRDCRRSWQNVFMRWVLRAWEKESCNPKTLIGGNFVPSEEVRTLLGREGIPEKFYSGQVTSFILHWRERGEKHNTWDSKFVNYVRMVWRREKKTGELSEKEQRRHQTLYERLTDDSWATEGPQLSEPDWGTYTE